jgi:prephenate dehydratase
MSKKNKIGTPRSLFSKILDNVTRFEVIDETGRAYQHRSETSIITTSLQDHGKTLKVFITQKKP